MADPGRLAQEAAALAGAVRGALGPRGGRALLVRPDGRALLTRDGRRLLEALGPQPPTARVMAAAACRLRGATGDGAKTFMLLLAAVLRGLRAASGPRGTARALRAFQSRVLERAALLGLRPRLLSALPAAEPGPGPELGADTLEALLEGYLGGRLAPGERRAVLRLGCELCHRCAARRLPALSLLGRHFGRLHAAAAGLPLAGSRVLPGLVLRGRLAARCPAGGELKALVVTRPLRPEPAAPGVERAVRSEGQQRAALGWCGRSAAAELERLRSCGVGLLLSSVRQHEEVIYHARLHGLSVVECLSSEEIALICEIAGISPYEPFSNSMHTEIPEVAVVTFCQPLLLGSQHYVHLGLCSVGTFQPHSLVLCGPINAVPEQHAAALQGAFTMLLQLFSTVGRSTGECGAQGERQGGAATAWSSSAAEKQLLAGSVSCGSTQLSEHQLRAPRGETVAPTADLAVQAASGPASHSEELNVPFKGAGCSAGAHKPCEQMGGMHESCQSDPAASSQSSHSTAVIAAGSAGTAATWEHPGVSEGLGKAGCRVIPFRPEHSCVSVAPNSSNIIEAGSVLPVGGYFEVLLHYYIEHYAKQGQQPAVMAVSSVVANALLSIPKALYGAERSSFTKFYLKTTNALRENQPLPVNERGLESVYCKYQLVTSVLHCATELLSIDLIIDVKRPPQKMEDGNSDDDF